MTTAPIDDLRRILAYDDAIDPRRSVTEIGSELHVVPFWTPSMCAAIIRASEAVGGFEPQPDDPVPGHEVSLAVVSPRLFEHVQNDLGRRIWPQLQEVWPLIDYCGLRDVFVIKYSADAQTELRIHHDVAQVSASVKLNDDYEGAELRFPRQDVSNATVPVGSLLVWPSLVTHPHVVEPLRSGVKYGLTVWFELPGQYT
ncbi:MAG: 2OG-Fe(II) oxygenase [Actinomycetota bacterium]|nr:2OG-Fe(II) oxygenase [Actinomycetota bacterium]MDA2971784.1 2OG-Fe(II) oxygenase [Actinomycetota bacterium]MDA3000561.1 2OG-Fe(II) oxygenase [Actinomycetota bacterium]